MPSIRPERPRPAPFPAVCLVALCATIGTGCAETPTPVVAVAGSGGFLNAGRLAVVDDARTGGAADFDTIFLSETTNRAGPALEAASSLVERPGLVGVVGHANSVASLAASQVYADHGVVQIAPSSTAPLYSDAGPFSFRVVPPDDVQGAFLARVLQEHLPKSTPVALFYVNDDYGRGLRRAVLDRIDLEHTPIVLDLPHAESDVQEADPGNFMDPLLASGARTVLWLGRVPILNVLLEKLHEHDESVTVFAGDAISRAALFSDMDEWWYGVRYVDFLDIHASEELRDFQRRFRDRFGENAGGPEVLTYDAVQLLLQAIREGARSGEEVRQYLRSLGEERPAFEGLSGRISFDANGDVARDLVLLTIPPREPQ